MALLNNLYPPTMPNLIPGFIRTQNCKIYFSISDYNSQRDISNVQVSLVDVKTNVSAFKTSLYPSGIKLTELQYDPTIEDNYCYFITINTSDLKGNAFALNEYYKVQLRFTSINAAAISLNTPQAISTWLNENTQYFSEWSRSCLLRGISEPSIVLNDLDPDEEVVLDTPLSELVGELIFQDSQQQDYLTEYSIKIYAEQGYMSKTGDPVYESGTIYLDEKLNNNIIDYNIKYAFLKDTHYTMFFSYKTSCLYSQQIQYSFSINKDDIENPFNLEIKTVPNNQYGYIDIEMTMDRNKHLFNQKKIIMYRSSSKDNFNNYEKIYEFEDFVTYFHSQDLSIENGIWYKYIVYILNDEGKTLYTPVSSTPIICVFEDIFLASENIQLRLQFNPSVTAFKYNVTESQQVTIGSKFPYIRKNGKNFYRTFTIGGLISSLVDEETWYNSYLPTVELAHDPFTTKQDVYKDSYELYTNYEKENNISDYLNPLYERLFREEVINFLYGNEVKLFKSPTEGNILIHLSNISFEPIASLGRVLYSFTATATEIDEANFDNYLKYNIAPLTTFEILTEAPALDIIKKENSSLVLVIDASGAEQNVDQDWILHLEECKVRRGRIV